MKKKVVIDLRMALIVYSKGKDKVVRVSDVCRKFGLSSQTFINWQKEAPDVVSVLFYIVKENPNADVFKALCEWQKPPTVLVFIRDFIKEYGCSFNDIVEEVDYA